ncbi:hypothetical protein V5799_023758 [Amblyomma americanum]|uniref:Defective in cullin neddylation protein n=1 Tax=Amblyomma americanum TaxID=6943 RepID=A0AAQ4FIA1_AMBAM
MFYPRLQPGRRGTFEPRHSEARALALFEKYRDPEEDAVLAEGIVRLCDDLGVRPEEFRVLLLAWKFGAQQMCRFTRDEFLSGCRALRADSVSAIQARFPELVSEAREPTRFRDLYRFTFRFGLETGQRTLPTDMAAQLWRLVFSLEPPPVLERWLAFLESHPEVRGITSDTWNMFLHFAETAGRDLSTYDDSEAWPSLFDDFVERSDSVLLKGCDSSQMSSQSAAASSTEVEETAAPAADAVTVCELQATSTEWLNSIEAHADCSILLLRQTLTRDPNCTLRAVATHRGHENHVGLADGAGISKHLYAFGFQRHTNSCEKGARQYRSTDCETKRCFLWSRDCA